MAYWLEASSGYVGQVALQEYQSEHVASNNPEPTISTI